MSYWRCRFTELGDDAPTQMVEAPDVWAAARLASDVGGHEMGQPGWLPDGTGAENRTVIITEARPNATPVSIIAERRRKWDYQLHMPKDKRS